MTTPHPAAPHPAAPHQTAPHQTAPQPTAAPTAAPAPAPALRTTPAWRTGDELPPLEIPVTRTLIVAGAVASRDYQDVHHDADLARAKGSPDVFMNILTTNGLVGRYITDHLGPAAVLRRVAIRLGAPNYPGDTMVLTGTVVAVRDRTVEIRVVGANGLGHHVTGTVTAEVAPA